VSANLLDGFLDDQDGWLVIGRSGRTKNASSWSPAEPPDQLR
jgi:hypothetical protein